MKSFVFFFIFLFFSLDASQYPAEISFLVADLKYSADHGVKICEVQQGIVSSFRGEAYAHKGESVIAKNAIDVLSLYVNKGWTVLDLHTDQQIQKNISESDQWVCKSSSSEIFNDFDFRIGSKLPIADRSNLSNYYGFTYLRPKQVKDHHKFSELYPGIILIDAASYPYWIDKAKMSSLFDLDPTLQQIKPRWGVFPRQYHPQLAGDIMEQIPADAFVIKPKGAFLGNGVIIVAKDNLDETLAYILQPSDKLRSERDSSYSFWGKTKEDCFIVEEFFESDLLAVPQFKNRYYQPTMRVAYLLVYNQARIESHFLGSYWLLPKISIEEEGSMNDRHKGYCKIPHYYRVDQEIESKVIEELKDPIKLFYQKMLERQ